MRVVLDTNILISALMVREGNPATIYQAWQEGQFILLTCAEHLDEVRATLHKPAIAERIKPYKAGGLINELKAVKGSVVNVTSIAGSRVHPFAGAAYATSKAALASLTREMASDFGRIGVRVNSIAPGEIDTSILSPGTEKIVEQQIPLHRLGTPDEVAKIIYVLCTETSSYVNGAEIHINGGQHV